MKETTNPKDNYIPGWQQQIVIDRLNELEQNPETGIDFDKMIADLENKYGL